MLRRFLSVLIVAGGIKVSQGLKSLSTNLKALQKSFEVAAIHEIDSMMEFERLVSSGNSNTLQLIGFQKSNCKPCMKVAPKFQQLSEKYHGKVNFFSVDATTAKEGMAIMRSQGIKSVPTFHMWRGGHCFDSIQGAKIVELEQLLEDDLQKIMVESIVTSTAKV